MWSDPNIKTLMFEPSGRILFVASPTKTGRGIASPDGSPEAGGPRSTSPRGPPHHPAARPASSPENQKNGGPPAGDFPRGWSAVRRNFSRRHGGISTHSTADSMGAKFHHSGLNKWRFRRIPADRAEFPPESRPAPQRRPDGGSANRRYRSRFPEDISTQPAADSRGAISHPFGPSMWRFR